MFLDEKQNSVAKRTVKLFPRLVIRKKSPAVAAGRDDPLFAGDDYQPRR